MKKNRTAALSEQKDRAKKIFIRLKKQYPSARTALVYADPLQLLVATILSAQCTDKKVNEVTKHLFKKFRCAQDFACAAQQELEQDIRPTGFFRNKAKSIIGAAQRICDAYGGRVPDSMEELTTLPGVARKTANIVLSSAFGKAEGIAVDVHVQRLSRRLGLSGQKHPEKIERDLMELVPRKEWLAFNYVMVDHGRTICMARKPLCSACVVSDLCHSAFNA